MATKPLVVIVGPTASGKSALALGLAEKFGGEIICADSRTIYRGLDVGSAKPTKEEQRRVPHWGLDLVNPGETFTAADFKSYASRKIDEIRKRGSVPFLVGGTGLYIDAVLFDYKFGAIADKTLRTRLSLLSLKELQDYCIKNNIELPQNSNNKRYVIRAIEQEGINHKRNVAPISTSIIVGIATENEQLKMRIRARSEQIFENGVVDEAIKLGKKYGWQNEAMTGNVYPIVHAYLVKELSLKEAIEQNTTRDWRLAKRQRTWLRRNPYIRWLDADTARRYLESVLVVE